MQITEADVFAGSYLHSIIDQRGTRHSDDGDELIGGSYENTTGLLHLRSIVYSLRLGVERFVWRRKRRPGCDASALDLLQRMLDQAKQLVQVLKGCMDRVRHCLRLREEGRTVWYLG